MKNLKERSGITLIALVITIIVLLILAGVAINLTLGKNGLLNRTKEAREKYEIATAKEYIEIKINECILEKGGDASLQDIIDYLAEDSSVTYYVALEEVGLVAGEIDIGSPKEVYVVYNNYQFKLDESKKVEYISEVNVDLEGKVSIEAQVKEHLGKNADGKYEASVLLKATGDAEISKLEIQNQDGTVTEIDKENIGTTGKDITIEFDKTYKVILTTANGHKYTKKVIEKSEETITTAEQLASFRDKVNSGLTYEGKTVKLGADIDLSTVCGADVGGKEVSWEPIGTETTIFKGTFDGNYNRINNLYINSDKYRFAGLFEYNKGSIENVLLENVYIYNYYESNALSASGGIVGYNSEKIEKCGINSGIISTYNKKGTRTYAAGIVGYSSGNKEIINQCYNKAEIVSESTYNSTSNEAISGGIIGGDGGIGLIENCYNVGTVTSKSYFASKVGGLVGRIYQNYGVATISTVKNSYNTGNVNGKSNSGTSTIYIATGGILGNDGWDTTTMGVNINNVYYKKDIAKYSYYKGNWSNPTGVSTKNAVDETTLQGYASNLGEAFTNDVKVKMVDESTGTEKEVWKYNNGYPILKWQLQENQVTE